jgi:hypothetical protein
MLYYFTFHVLSATVRQASGKRAKEGVMDPITLNDKHFFLRFRFPKRETVPVMMRRFEIAARERPKFKPPEGIPLTSEPMRHISLQEFLQDIKNLSGYALDGSYEDRPLDVGPKNTQIVRFDFFRQRERAMAKEDTVLVMQGLIVLCNEALWTVQMYLNPAKDGGQTLSINMNNRTPFMYRADGTPAVLPTHHLRIVSGRLCLIKD